MSSKEEMKHDADLAGGDREVVFSSDGAAPMSITFPVSSDTTEEITSEEMSPEQAFEIFAGKLFAPNPYNQKISSPEEAPLQKLARIQREIDDLKNDLAQQPSNAETASHLLQSQLSLLQDQFQKLSLERMKQQGNLSVSIQGTIERIGESKEQPVPISSSPDVIPSSSLQERIQKLEVLLGSPDKQSNNSSLLERLDQLERQYEKLDEKKLDVLHKRAKIIRQDLEAAAKARHKLNANEGGENAKKISSLYDELEQLQGLTGYLPSLVTRLQTLAHVHADAASHSARFVNVEQTVTMLQNNMESIEESIDKLENSLKTSAKTMQENVQSLEERMRTLS